MDIHIVFVRFYILAGPDNIRVCAITVIQDRGYRYSKKNGGIINCGGSLYCNDGR